MKFNHILIPVDFAEQNQVAIAAAVELARQFASRVTLLHVIEMVDYVTDDELQQFYDKLEEKAVAELEQLAAPVKEQGIDVEGVTLFGKRVRAIVEHCSGSDVDLVVLSSHQVDLNQPTESLGTLSHQISILCPCPVLMVK